MTEGRLRLNALWFEDWGFLKVVYLGSVAAAGPDQAYDTQRVHSAPVIHTKTLNS